MSAILQQAVIDTLRGAFSAAELAEVRSYGGEFSAAEVDRVSYNCPAALVSVLGWQKAEDPRLTGRRVRGARMACFVAVKHPNRELRMRQAMTTAERIATLLEDWTPPAHEALVMAPLAEICRVENLYSTAMDRLGQALWLVDWTQAVKPLLPAGELFDLLAVDIVDTTHPGRTPAPAQPPGAPLVVTEDVRFAARPPD